MTHSSHNASFKDLSVCVAIQRDAYSDHQGSDFWEVLNPNEAGAPKAEENLRSIWIQILFDPYLRSRNISNYTRAGLGRDDLGKHRGTRDLDGCRSSF
ncbi:hypothetical protein TNCV_3889731 [Trichonephila clavipes]|nr:hypothetical protein TNCV_3889731 [Trichonephila clavipes]